MPIHDGTAWVRENGGGIFEDCDIHAKAGAGVLVESGGNPTALDQRLPAGKIDGHHAWRFDKAGIEELADFNPAVADALHAG